MLSDSEAASRCRELVDVGAERWEMSVSEWTTELGPWNDLVERGRKLFGERWTFAILANIGAGIRAKDKKIEQASELHDPSGARQDSEIALDPTVDRCSQNSS